MMDQGRKTLEYWLMLIIELRYCLHLYGGGVDTKAMYVGSGSGNVLVSRSHTGGLNLRQSLPCSSFCLQCVRLTCVLGKVGKGGIFPGASGRWLLWIWHFHALYTHQRICCQLTCGCAQDAPCVNKRSRYERKAQIFSSLRGIYHFEFW